MAAETERLARAREVELWIARIRLGAVLFAAVEVGLRHEGSVFSVELPVGVA
jgi:hypothetical protein